jgi:hypothetical protein
LRSELIVDGERWLGQGMGEFPKRGENGRL